MNNRKSKQNKSNSKSFQKSQIDPINPVVTKSKSLYFLHTAQFVILVGVALRLILILYMSRWQNILKQELTGTDIDYKVFTDAAYYESPYHRHTYRYSPLLAYLMKFNHVCQFAGKIAFVIFDVIAMIALIYINRKSHRISILKLYAYNPLFIYLTARGSCESISLALMFWSFYFIFQNNGNITLNDVINKTANIEDNRTDTCIGYLLYGLWVHFRVYPIILLPLILIHEYKISQRAKTKFTNKFIQLSLYAGGIFALLFVIFTFLYGYQFIHETYLYHLTRLDNRHSISPIFYEIYLTLNSQSFIRSMAQICVIVAVSKRVHQSLSPYYAHFLITYAFVNFNKVITMQYYMWIFGTILLLLPESSLLTNSHRRFEKSFSYIMQWILGIVLWVWLSIRLQKDGENVFNLMWLVCIIKLFTDLWAVIGFMSTVQNKLPYHLAKDEQTANLLIKQQKQNSKSENDKNIKVRKSKV